MNDHTKTIALGPMLLLLGLVLIGTPIQAQVDCGAGAAPGDLVVCDTTGIRPETLITINAAADGVTSMTVNTPRAPSGIATDVKLIRGMGAGRIELEVLAGIRIGQIDFSANSGGVDIAVAAHDRLTPVPGGWLIQGTSQLGSGDDRLQILDGGFVTSSGKGIARNGDRRGLQLSGIDFGDGGDVLDNAGVMLVGGARFARTVSGGGEDVTHNSFHYPVAHEMTLVGLEVFANSGTITFGGWAAEQSNRPASEFADLFCLNRPGNLSAVPTRCGELYPETDGEIATTLTMPDTHFMGMAGSTLVLDTSLGMGRPQRNCQQRSVIGGILSLPGADCMELLGGQTSGVTQVVLKDQVPGDLGAYNPDGIVIVDVTQGKTGAGHFVLSPESDGYDPTTQAIDKGLFLFPLVYDEAAQQHKLVSVAGQRAHRLPLLVQAVQGMSRSASRQWFERRSDLRNIAEGERDGAWVRLTHDSASRDGKQTTSAFGNTYAFDNSYDVDSSVFSIGRDFRLGSAWVIGGSGSYINAALDFDQDNVQADFDGAAIAGHASYRAGTVYFDSQVQMSWIEMDFADPRFDVATSEYNVLDASTQSLDARAELGLHLDLGGGLYAEPMLGASWVRTEFSEMTLYSADPAGRPTNEVFGGDSPQSLRASLGGRVGYDQRLQGWRLSYLLSARYWEELQGDTQVRVSSHNPDGSLIPGTETRVSDTFDSGLGELALGVELGDAAGRLNGYLQANSVFGDYESLGLTAGFRVLW